MTCHFAPPAARAGPSNTNHDRKIARVEGTGKHRAHAWRETRAPGMFPV